MQEAFVKPSIGLPFSEIFNDCHSLHQQEHQDVVAAGLARERTRATPFILFNGGVVKQASLAKATRSNTAPKRMMSGLGPSTSSWLVRPHLCVRPNDPIVERGDAQIAELPE